MMRLSALMIFLGIKIYEHSIRNFNGLDFVLDRYAHWGVYMPHVFENVVSQKISEMA